jgi:hypothetical protein
MSYKLLKPYTKQERIDFILEYNRKKGLRIEETELALFALEENEIIVGNEAVINSNYENEQAKEREENFKNNFFKIKDACWFRKQPKGYNSAIESLNTAFNVVSVLGKLPANTLTFYIAPDFSIEEQCTENWLVKNSYKNEEMTPQEFGEFYASFMTAWNKEEHL